MATSALTPGTLHPYDLRMNACRLATTADADAIREIYAPIVRDTPISFEYEVPSAAEIATRVEQVLQTRPWLVYEEGSEILGYTYATTFRNRTAYDWGPEVSIYVRSDVQKKG